MPSRASAAQSASGRDSPINQLSSPRLPSRESVTSNMGRRCAHDGCTHVSLTGGPKCHSHTSKPQASPPIRGSAQIQITKSLSPPKAKVQNESASPGRPDTMPPASAINGPNRRSGDSQYPPHPAKGLHSHKSLPAKATARKSVAKPGQRREDSNSAAADESEIVVASDSKTSANKLKSSKRPHDNVLESPRKKQRLGLSNATAESEEATPLPNGATHKVPAKRLEISTSRPNPQPEITTPAVSFASLAAAQTDESNEQLRVESRGREVPPLKALIHLDPSLNDKSKEAKAKKKMSRTTYVVEHSSEKLKAVLTAASNSPPKEATGERDRSNGRPPTQGQSLKKSGQGTSTSPSAMDPNKSEAYRGLPVVLSFPKSFLGSDAVGPSKSTESSRQSTILAPGPALKKPRGALAGSGQIGHKPPAQSETAYNSHATFALRLDLKGIPVSGPAVEATQPAPSTTVTNNAGVAQNSQSAVIPNPTAKLQIPGVQPIATSAVKTESRTEKAKDKTPGVEPASGQVPLPAPQSSGMSSRPGASTSDASSSTDRLNFWATVRETSQPAARALTFTGKEYPIPQDVASCARNQTASSQRSQAQERRPITENEHGRHGLAAPRQPVSLKHSMRTTEILSHGLEKTKSGLKAPIAIREDSRGSQGHQTSSALSQHKEATSKLQPEYSEHPSALPQRTKGQSLIQKEVVAPPKNNRTAGQAGSSTETTNLPTTNGVASTANLEKTGTQSRKQGDGTVETEQPPPAFPMVIDLVSSDSDSSPCKTMPGTKPTIKAPQEARPGLRLPSFTVGPIPTLTSVPPKPGPSATGLDESQQLWKTSLATGEPISRGPEGKTQISPKPSARSEPLATMSGDKTADSDKPLLSPSRRWTNVTHGRWKSLALDWRKQMLQDQHDESKFDGFIYGPVNAPNHPHPSSRVNISVETSPVPKMAPLNNFRHFDPRVHWTHERPKEWHERKRKEIAHRGNRKAHQNFGQAAARRARLKASVRPPKVDLPERVERNSKWLAALSELDDMVKSHREAERAKAGARRKRQKATKNREGDTVMQDAPPETPDSTNEAPVIGGMRRPPLEVMIGGRWRERPVGS